MYIHQLKQKERAQVLGYHKGNSAYRHRLLEMGLIPGICFVLIQIAPLGDPIQIEIRGYTLSLRKDEAAILKIRRVE